MTRDPSGDDRLYALPDIGVPSLPGDPREWIEFLVLLAVVAGSAVALVVLFTSIL